MAEIMCNHPGCARPWNGHQFARDEFKVGDKVKVNSNCFYSREFGDVVLTIEELDPSSYNQVKLKLPKLYSSNRDHFWCDSLGHLDLVSSNAVKELQVFDRYSKCVKCGDVGHHQRAYLFDSDQIKRTCNACGYVWYELPLHQG